MSDNNRSNQLFNRNDHPASWRNSAGLMAMVEQIPDPAYYLAGLPKPELPLPENIVLFRRHPDKLKHAPMSHAAQHVLIINLRGPGDIILNERRLRLVPGAAALVFAGQSHSYANLQPPLTWLFISFKIAAPDCFATLRDSTAKLSPMAWHYIHQLVADYNSSVRAMPIVASRIVFNLSLLLMELAESSPRRIASKIILEQVAQNRIRKIQQYVLAHIREPVHIADLARQVNMSASGLRFFARKTMRHGLGHYIRHTRLACACELMNATDLTLTQIGEQCGFGSIYAFSRAFKQQLRVAPSRYRARLKKSSRQTRRRTADG